MSLITPEYYAYATTTLTAGYTAGSGTIVVNAVTGFSLTNQFRVMISNSITKALIAILKVTAVGGTGNKTWTVSSDGLDANASSGDIVDLCLTAGAMDQIRADASGQGTYANIPTTGKAGDRYQCTDAPYVAIHDGSNWHYFIQGAVGYSEVFPPALLGSWNWDNQGSSTVDSTRGYFHLKFIHTSATNARAYYRAKTAPYTIVALLDTFFSPVTSLTGASSNGAGMAFRDAAAKLVAMYAGPSLGGSTGGMITQKWTSTTAVSADYLSVTPGSPVAAQLLFRSLWWKIVDNSTNLVFSWSIDGQNWYQFDSRSRTDFFASGSTGAGLFCYTNAGDVLMNVLSWQES